MVASMALMRVVVLPMVCGTTAIARCDPANHGAVHLSMVVAEPCCNTPGSRDKLSMATPTRLGVRHHALPSGGNVGGLENLLDHRTAAVVPLHGGWTREQHLACDAALYLDHGVLGHIQADHLPHIRHIVGISAALKEGGVIMVRLRYLINRYDQSC